MRPKKRSFIVILFIVILIFTGLYFIINQQTPLPGYVGDTSSITSTLENEDTIGEMETYQDPDTGFSISIPIDWQQVTMDGYQTFIHSASASSIQIQVQDYYPQVNMVTQETVSSLAAQQGYTLLNFYWNDNSSYVTMYQGTGNNGAVMDYIELVYFDRSNVITVYYTFNSEYYDRLEDIITATVDSISWERADPIQADLRLYYNEIGNFEFATPINWISGIQNGTYYAQDESTGSALTVSVAESTSTFAGVSQLDYVNQASTSRSNFMLSSYNADDNIIYAMGSYTYNNQQIIFVQYLIASGSFQYNLTFECPASSFDGQKERINTAVEYFRIF